MNVNINDFLPFLFGPYGLTAALAIAVVILWRGKNADIKSVRDALEDCKKEHKITQEKCREEQKLNTEKIIDLQGKAHYLTGRLDAIEAHNILKQASMSDITQSLVDGVVNALKGQSIPPIPAGSTYQQTSSYQSPPNKENI